MEAICLQTFINRMFYTGQYRIELIPVELTLAARMAYACRVFNYFPVPSKLPLDGTL
jgi:hypothetical protein